MAFTHSLTHSLAYSSTHSLTHSPTYSPTHPLAHPLTHPLTHAPAMLSQWGSTHPSFAEGIKGNQLIGSGESFLVYFEDSDCFGGFVEHLDPDTGRMVSQWVSIPVKAGDAITFNHSFVHGVCR